ncbi:MAG TPA: DUF4350 domain-containing protein [Candidatus Polarisedimenticolaceae bacterium]|nr:DUF4350 domain-containing protein [Candidatus Polarisedimenticolaceae bacterium]
MAVTRREDLPAAEGIDALGDARAGAGALAYTTLVLAAMLFAVLLAARFRVAWDLTRQGAMSLSPKSMQALAALERPVSIHGLMQDNDRRRGTYWDLLQRYRQASPEVSVEIFDPNARPAAFQALDLSDIDRDTIKNGVSVAISGSRHAVFRGVGEEDVTNAILEAGSSAPRVVGVLRGYGARELDETADGGVSRLRDALLREYDKLVDVRLDAGIPSDIALLVAFGPRAPVPPADVERLAAWLDAGGRFLLLVDPEHPTGLESIGSAWGIEATRIRVVDRSQGLRGQAEIPLVSEYTRHPIVRPFGPEKPLALPLAAAVVTTEGRDPAVFRDALVKTSAYAEGLAPTGERSQGPFALAAAAYKPARADATAEGRLVVVGDIAFATNAFLAEASNRDFLLNCAGWLSRARGQVTIRPSPLAAQMIRLRQGDGAIFLAIAIAPPFLVLAIGVAVHMRRRRL